VISAMPRPRPPHLHREVTRHGNAVWYVRVGKGPRIRLRAAFGSEEFDAEYQAALSGKPQPSKGRPRAGTLAWLLERYRETTAWTTLSAATRRQRENIFKHVLASAGPQSFVKITEQVIAAGKERRASTPAQARNFLDAMRGLFRWAFDAKHVPRDPTAGIKNPKRKKGPGFKKWSEEQVERYETRWPIGTKERVWLDVLLYTGLRRGDAVVIGRQHVRNGVATLQTEKSGETVTVTIPILPVLARTLAAGPCGDLAYICGARGHPLTKESFGNAFKDACRAAGINEKGKAAHGLRKVGATRAAENGATVAELEALFGWRGGTMASLYTRDANRARLAKGAIGKLERTPDEQSIPAPDDPVRAAGGKPA
jgi:integrase